MTVTTLRSVEHDNAVTQRFQEWLLRAMAERSITRRQLQERTGVTRGTRRVVVPRQHPLMFRQLGALLGDITPLQWQRLRRLADDPPH